MYIKIMLGVILIFYVTDSYAGDWRSNYRNSNGVPCCGENDCFKIPMSRITQGACGFMVDGKCIPKSHIKPSEDKNYWHCPIFECFFVPGAIS